MSTNSPLSKFFKLYQVDYWLYKQSMLKGYLDSYDELKEDFQRLVKKVDDVDYINMLKLEIHFTYFQMIEALFELIFAVETAYEKKDDQSLWFYLSFSDWRKNLRRIENISNRNESILYKQVGKDNQRSFLQYIFQFIYDPVLDPALNEKQIDNMRSSLIIFAKDFSDRNEYNAYKHSLRLYHSPMKMAIAREGTTNFEILGQTDNAISFLEKDKDGIIYETSKGFDPERDYNMSLLIDILIKNIINTRRSYYLNEDMPYYSFVELDLSSINISKGSFIKTSFPILKLKKPESDH